ncbi:hypothetical protein D3C74_236010 [compost metagenome]
MIKTVRNPFTPVPPSPDAAPPTSKAPPAAVPNIMPRLRDRASKLLIRPRCSFPALPMTRLLLGEVTIPIETPSNTMSTINRKSGYDAFRKPRAISTPPIVSSPAASNGKEPSLSDQLPKIGEATINASGYPIIINPAIAGGIPSSFRRNIGRTSCEEKAAI